MSTHPSLPESCGVAFKEWAGVCEALADGRQSIILRKGGIAEEAGAFRPEHVSFWLYPTHVHEAQQGLRIERANAAAAPRDRVLLQAVAVVNSVGFVDRPELLDALEPLHVWTRETVLKRFYYRQPGVWVLGVRIYRLSEPVSIRVTAEHAGCKTWVPLEAALSTSGLSPALDDDEATRRLDKLARILLAPH